MNILLDKRQEFLIFFMSNGLDKLLSYTVPGMSRRNNSNKSKATLLMSARFNLLDVGSPLFVAGITIILVNLIGILGLDILA
jgi:hypothetical protein